MQSMITAGNRRSQINRSIHNQAPNVIRRGSACVPARLATYHQLQHPREIKSRPPTVSGKALAAGKSIHRQLSYRWQAPFRSQNRWKNQQHHPSPFNLLSSENRTPAGCRTDHRDSDPCSSPGGVDPRGSASDNPLAWRSGSRKSSVIPEREYSPQ